MLKLKNALENKIVIDKSIFITHLFVVHNLEEINNYLKQLKKEYFDATHHCYAYIINEQTIQKCSDDKEPSKTAGWPMLDVLKKKDLTDVLAVTIRYFGGIKLGAGGLVRAYSSSVSSALEKATFLEQKPFYVYTILLNYSEYNRLADFLNEQKVLELFFANEVTIKLALLEKDAPRTIQQIMNATFGKAKISAPVLMNIDIEKEQR